MSWITPTPTHTHTQEEEEEEGTFCDMCTRKKNAPVKLKQKVGATLLRPLKGPFHKKINPKSLRNGFTFDAAS
jgi:hypothetical protein